MKHTPAPWKLTLINPGPSKGSVFEHWRIGNEEAGNAIVAECYDWTLNKSERDANARLIAAAPELLEALEDCYSELNQLAFLSGDNLAKPTLDKARAAIAKAKGE